MRTRFALDTNILAYAEGVNGIGKRDVVLGIIDRLPAGMGLIPVQVLGESFNVLVRKAGWSPSRARDALLAWSDVFGVVPTAPDVMIAAVDLAALHKLAIWDAVILAAAADAGCRILLSEDLQHGFTWSGVTVVDPFAETPHPAFVTFLTGPKE